MVKELIETKGISASYERHVPGKIIIVLTK